ncbi:MAG: hypothetical protein IPJ74_23045 [Saprospiraceae bacterium]|nr:hypothetical protein [Saprospiraceae bacterium]
MRKLLTHFSFLTIFLLLAFTLSANELDYKTLTKDFVQGKAAVQSISVMSFGGRHLVCW